MWFSELSNAHLRIVHTARKYQSPRAVSALPSQDRANDVESPTDMGWEWPENKTTNKKASWSLEIDSEDEKTQRNLQTEERKEAAAVHCSASVAFHTSIDISFAS